MCAAVIDQILPSGELVQDYDTKLTRTRRDELIISALPSAKFKVVDGQKALVYKDLAFLRAQITYLGFPWQSFKKRMQIGQTWKRQFDHLSSAALQVKFIGVYTYRDTLIFVDLDPTPYLTRKGNNSAAHIAANDLYQAQVHGVFERVDKNGNHLTSIRADHFQAYLDGRLPNTDPRFDVFQQFNDEFFTLEYLEGLAAVQEMYVHNHPQTFQPEWAGFYLEFRIEKFLKNATRTAGIEAIHDKKKGSYDYDLRFMSRGNIEFYGDLKASNAATYDAPGNDAVSLTRCLNEFGKFWYVIYEHDTIHARDHDDIATVQWNEWKRSVGHVAKPRDKKNGEFNPLSYRTKYKEAVRFTRMMIIEVNPANQNIVLGTFNQGVQQSGAARNKKVTIKKKDLDNFLIYTYEAEALPLS